MKCLVLLVVIQAFSAPCGAQTVCGDGDKACPALQAGRQMVQRQSHRAAHVSTEEGEQAAQAASLQAEEHVKKEEGGGEQRREEEGGGQQRDEEGGAESSVRVAEEVAVVEGERKVELMDFPREWYRDPITGFASGQLKSVKDGSMCLDYGQGKDKNVHMWKCHSKSNQKWYFSGSEIKTFADCKLECLDTNWHNNNVYVHKCHGGTNQQWSTTNQDNFFLVNKREQKVLDWSWHNNVIVYGNKGNWFSENQRWKFQQSPSQSDHSVKSIEGNARFNLYAGWLGKCLEHHHVQVTFKNHPEFSGGGGTFLGLQPCNHEPTQKWMFEGGQLKVKGYTLKDGVPSSDNEDRCLQWCPQVGLTSRERLVFREHASMCVDRCATKDDPKWMLDRQTWKFDGNSLKGQDFTYTTDFEPGVPVSHRFENHCLQFGCGSTDNVFMQPCNGDGNQMWWAV